MFTEISGVNGQLPTGKIVIVASRYNEAICDSLVRGSIETRRARAVRTALAKQASDHLPIVAELELPNN